LAKQTVKQFKILQVNSFTGCQNLKAIALGGCNKIMVLVEYVKMNFNQLISRVVAALIVVNELIDSLIHYFEDLYGYPWGHIIVIGFGLGLQVWGFIEFSHTLWCN
jgi:hypothetical protein